MGLDITCKAGKGKLSFRLSNNDIEVCDFLRRKGFDKEIDIIFNVSNFGESTPVDQELLVKSVNHLLTSIKGDSGILLYTYSIKYEIPRNSGQYSSGTGSVSGFEIDGELYSIEAGLDKCELSKLKQDSDGMWRNYEPKDVRNEKTIITSGNFTGDFTIGNIIIEKKKKPTGLIKHLEKLKSFLSKVDVKVIQKTLG
jgi:hypothetical protein